MGHLYNASLSPYSRKIAAQVPLFISGIPSANHLEGLALAYQGWFRTLRLECGALFGRAPPQEEPLSFWRRISGACGGLAAATGKLLRQLRVTLFGRYRCHQRRICRA